MKLTEPGFAVWGWVVGSDEPDSRLRSFDGIRKRFLVFLSDGVLVYESKLNIIGKGD